MASVTITDDYTGDLSGRTDAQRLHTPHAEIVKMSVDPMDNNVYLIIDSITRNAVLVDAANDADRILELTDSLGVTVKLIVTTHQHFDHWQALADVVAATAAPTAAGRADVPGIPVNTDRALDDGDVINVSGLSMSVITLVGHTPGSIALAMSDGATHLFTGDSLFPGGVGKTHSPSEFAALLNDVRTKLFQRFDDNAIVYPGHGKDTTLGVERPSLTTWAERGW